MEIEIEVNGKKEKIEFIDPTGEDQIYYWKQMQEIDKSKKEGEVDIQGAIKALEVKDRMVVRLCPKFKNVEEVRKLSLREKNKITSEMENQILFLKFSDSAKNSVR